MPSPHKYVAKNNRVTWKVRFRVHDPVTNKLVGTSDTFDTEAEAWELCRLIQAVGADEAARIHEDRKVDESSPTLDQWIERYITSLTGIEDGTKLEYRRVYSRTWKPLIGRFRLTELTKDKIAGAVNDLAARELSGTNGGDEPRRYADKSIANAWGPILAPAIREAHEEGLIDKNPCRGIKLPRQSEHERVDHRYLSYDEFDLVLEEIPALWKPLVLTLAGTGMRWGEAQALTVGDVDLNAPVPVIRVVRAAKWTGTSKRKIGPPKSRKSRRSITLPPQVVEALEPLVEGRARNLRLFTVAGKPLQHKYFWDHVWRPALKRAGLDDPQPRIHDLRHTHVAWLIALGIGLPVIQARLGHKSIKTTIDTYGHLMPDIQAAAAHAASVAFSQVQSLSTGAELAAIETGLPRPGSMGR